MGHPTSASLAATATLSISNSGDVTYLAVPVRIATPTLHHEPFQPLIRESPSPTAMGVLDLPPPLLAASIEAATQTSVNSSLESVAISVAPAAALKCDNVLDAIDVVDNDNAAVRGTKLSNTHKSFAEKLTQLHTMTKSARPKSVRCRNLSFWRESSKLFK